MNLNPTNKLNLNENIIQDELISDDEEINNQTIIQKNIIPIKSNIVQPKKKSNEVSKLNSVISQNYLPRDTKRIIKKPGSGRSKFKWVKNKKYF